LAEERTRPQEAVKYYSVQLLSNQAVAAAGLFIPNLAILMGSTNSFVGVLGASFSLAFFASSYIFSRRTDIEGSRRYLNLGLVLSSVILGLVFLSQSVESLFLSYTAAGIAMGMYPTALLTYVFGKRVRLGRFSSVGSLGACTGLLAAGLIADQLSLKSVFIFGSIIFLVSFFASMALPPIPQERHKVPFFPMEIFKDNSTTFLSFLIRHTAANLVWVIYPLYLTSLNLSYLWISVLYFINPFVQFILMITLTDRISANRLMILGLFFSAVAFLSMFLSFEAWHIVFVQLFVAASWSFLYVGAIRQVTEKDVRKATSIGLLTSIIYMGNIIGPLFGGMLSEATGSFKGNMMTASIMTSLSLILYLVRRRKESLHEIRGVPA
jgi:DHA1 family multidrug resistance protein-like MFS transporter